VGVTWPSTESLAGVVIFVLILGLKLAASGLGRRHEYHDRLKAGRQRPRATSRRVRGRGGGRL
jgi:hypothetical protein